MVKEYKDDIWFHVDSDSCIFQVFQPRTFELPSMDYEANENIVRVYANVLLSKPIDVTSPRFDRYEKRNFWNLDGIKQTSNII